MKRRTLVLLLTFTLVLSYIPVIAFADSEAEDSLTIIEQVEDGEAEPGEPEQTEPETSETECPHEYTYTKVIWDPGEVDYSVIDNLQHKVKGMGNEVTRCAVCGEELSRKTIEIETQEKHFYINHKCRECGHVNTCAHGNTRTYEDWNPEDVTYTSISNSQHKVTGIGAEVTWCDDCDDLVSKKEIRINTKEYHDYEDGACVDCGHENTCEHLSTYYEYYYDPDKCTIVDLDDGYHHEVAGRIYKNTWCKNCEEFLSEEDLGYTAVPEEHDYDSNSECIYCGYKNNERIYGASRYDTAIAAAERYKEATGSKFENIIVAYGENFPDALSGGYLAKVVNAPILLVKPSEENKIADYIIDNLAFGGAVYILGGTGVVSESFEEAVKNKGIETERLGGADRYETNLEILKKAEEAAGIKAEEMLVCTGANYPDSLSASAAGLPILLVKDTLTDGQKEYIKGLSIKQFYLIGGEAVVKPAIKTGLTSLGYDESQIERLFGATRYETSTKVADKFFKKTKTVILAYAQNFPDGLSGGPLALVMNAPIVLTDSKTTTAATGYVKSADAAKNITLGGPALISDTAVKTIMGR